MSDALMGASITLGSDLAETVEALKRNPVDPDRKHNHGPLGEFVAALADEVWFAHTARGGRMERLAQVVAAWGNAARGAASA